MPSPPNRFNNIRVISGQTKRLRITIKDSTGRPAPLNRATEITLVAVDHDGQQVISKSLSNGISIEDAGKGRLLVELSSTDTALAAGTYKYSVWVVYEGDPPVRDPVVHDADMVVAS